MEVPRDQQVHVLLPFLPGLDLLQDPVLPPLPEAVINAGLPSRWSESSSRILPQPFPQRHVLTGSFGVCRKVPSQDLPMLIAGPGCGQTWDDLRGTWSPRWPLFVTGFGDV